MALVYHCHLEFTAEQREADSDHGIFESLTRTLSLDPGAKTFSYDFHYYYEYEGVGYNLITCTKNDTKFQGTYEQQGNKIVATITGGTQNATVIKEIYRTMSQKQLSSTLIKSLVGCNLQKMAQC